MGNKFRLGRKIGSGSFGEIYLGLYIHDDDIPFCFSEVFSLSIGNSHIFGFAGTNIQTNEEVAIKLVSKRIAVFSSIYTELLHN